MSSFDLLVPLSIPRTDHHLHSFPLVEVPLDPISYYAYGTLVVGFTTVLLLDGSFTLPSLFLSDSRTYHLLFISYRAGDVPG